MSDKHSDAKTPGLEPVAWRWRHSSQRNWQYGEEKPEGPSIHLFKVEPLYAALAPGNAGAVAPGFTSSWQEELSLSETMDRIGNAGAVESGRPDGWVLVPRELTAENRAKTALIGEFTETFDYMDDEGDECRAEIPVSWSTIKAIHKAIVKHFADHDFSCALCTTPTPAALDPVREALKVCREMLRGEMLESAVVDVETMTPLGTLIDRALSHPAPGNAGEANIREALDWLINCVECEVNVKGTTSVFQLRLAKAKAALAAPASNPQEGGAEK